MSIKLGALAVGDVHQHVDGTDDRTRCITDRGRERHEVDPRPIGSLGDSIEISDCPIFLDGRGHRTLVVGKWSADGPIELPRTAPLALTNLRSASPKLGSSFVVEADPSLFVGRVDRNGKRLQDGVEIAVACKQSCTNARKEPRTLELAHRMCMVERLSHYRLN